MAIKIFIDQAHNPLGTFDTGLFLNGVSETDVVYNMGIYLASFFKTGLSEVRLSRPTPTTVIGTDIATSMSERVQMANDWPADFFITLHCNSSPDPLKTGTRIYVKELYGTAHTIADIVMRNIIRKVDTKDDGVHIANYYSLENTHMPAIFIAAGYLSNFIQAQRLNDTTYQYRFASGIYNGLVEYYLFA